MNIETKKSLNQIAYMSSVGSNHGFDGQVAIDSNLFNQLSKDAQSDITWKATHFLEEIRNMIEAEWAKEYRQEERAGHIRRLTELFHEAGFDTIHVKVIDNQYSKDPFYYARPWLLVTTKKGVFKIGWRKRVINLDWSESDIKIFSEDLFRGENTTKGDRSIHCWSEEKAIEYLGKLKECSTD